MPFPLVTKARDLRDLSAAGYAISCVTPFDLFPQTRHLEVAGPLAETPREGLNPHMPLAR